MYIVDVIEDFTSDKNLTSNLFPSYDQNKIVSLENLKEGLYWISKSASELFGREYNNANPALGNANVAFLESIEKRADGALVVKAARGDYKMVIALRNFLQKYVEQNEEAIDFIYRNVTPIGLGVVTTTKDNCLLLSRRSDKADVPGSMINYWVGNWDQEGMYWMPTIKERLENRAFVKVGLGPEDYVIKKPIGIFRDRQLSQNPAIMYSGELPDLTADQAKAKLRRAKSNSKFADKEVIAIDLDEKKLREHLVKEAHNYVGNGFVAIAYRLKEIFGKEFFLNILEDNKSVFNISNYSFRN